MSTKTHFMRTLSLLLSVCMVFGMIYLPASAEEAVAPEGTVAAIGAEYYETLQAAVDAAQSGETVKLVDDICLEAMVTVASDDELTLDLNGNAITVTLNPSNTSRHLYALDVYGKLTIQDTKENGSITSRGIYVQEGAKVTVNSGSIYGIDANGGSALFMYGGEVVVNGGHIEQKAEGTYNFAIRGSAGKVTVNGGWVGGNHGAIDAAGAAVVINNGNFVCTGTEAMTDNVLYSSGTGSITIYGGTFIADNDSTSGGCCVYDANGGVTIYGGSFSNSSGGDVWGTTGTTIKGGTFENLIETSRIADGYVMNENGTVVPTKTYAAEINGVGYETLAEAIAALKDGDTLIIKAGEHSEGTLKLPAALSNVTIKGEDGAILKDTSIVSADGSSVKYIGLTIDNIHFENGRILMTGQRTGEVIYQNITITNCEFKNLNDTTSNAAVHFNMKAEEAINGFTFTNNVIDGVTGGTQSGINARVTGKVTISGNVINNVALRSFLIYITSDDGVADEFVVTGNTFSNSTGGRLQCLTNNSAGTDAVKLVVSNNIFQNIGGYQICYWSFNAEATTTDFSKNYYDVNIPENPGKIYFNGEAESVEDLVALNVYPYYSALNADGTIDTSSLVNAPEIKNYVAQIGDTKYESLQAAIDAAQAGETITLLADIELESVIVIAKDKKLTIDIGDFDITFTSTTENEAMITNNGDLTIEGNEGVINYNYVGAADPTFGKGNYTITNKGTLTINGGKITIANLRAHAKYPIQNDSSAGDAVLVVNGGHLYNFNTSAIRMLCKSNVYKNIVTINGGLIEGYSAIWVQNPYQDKTVHAELYINGGEIRTTAAAYVNGSATVKEVSSRLYFTLKTEAAGWTEGSILKITGGLFNENLDLLQAPDHELGEATYNGNVKHPYEAVVTAPTCVNSGYTTYTCSACGESYVGDEVAALGHNEVTVTGTAPTCTQKGVSDGIQCETCRKWIVKKEAIPATGHQYGETDTVCTVCGEGERFVKPTATVENGVITVIDPSNAASKLYVFYVGAEKTDAALWADLVAIGKQYTAVNGKNGFMSYELNNLPELTVGGEYVIHVVYTNEEGGTSRARVEATVVGDPYVEPEVPATPDIAVNAETNKVETETEYTKVLVFYVGEQTPGKLWAQRVEAGKLYPEVNGTKGYKIYTADVELPTLYEGGNYILYLYYTEDGATKSISKLVTVAEKDEEIVEEPSISIDENGKVVADVAPENFSKVIVSYAGSEDAGKTWASMVAAGKLNSEINGTKGYKIYTSMEKLPTLTETGDYVLYLYYMDGETMKSIRVVVTV